MITIPSPVRTALSMLSDAGFEANIVGGCVRDFLLGRTPSDYDITTNALPEQTELVFHDYKCIDIGKKHGTIAVMIDKMQIEITTYRIDGEYADKRHPESVMFSRELKDDLSRRDFTINALAYNEKDGITDCFGGKEDLENRLIRCVGEPEKRFEEDALRIMRAVRFASQLDFEIDKCTEEHIFALKNTLKMISAERIRTELNKLLLGKAAYRILLNFRKLIAVFIPEAEGSRQTESKIWEHTIQSIDKAENDLTIRLALLLHDLGKLSDPSMENDNSSAHASLSKKMAFDILKRLKYDNKSIKDITTLIEYHETRPQTRQDIKKAMSEIGPELFFKLLSMQEADFSSECSQINNEKYSTDEIRKTAEDIINKQECIRMSEMKINGNMLAELGCSGKMTGTVLNTLFESVLSDRIKNQNDILTGEAKKIIASMVKDN